VPNYGYYSNILDWIGTSIVIFEVPNPLQGRPESTRFSLGAPEASLQALRLTTELGTEAQRRQWAPFWRGKPSGNHGFWPQKDGERSGFSLISWVVGGGWPAKHWLVGGFEPTPKNDGLKVTWDDEIPNCFWKVIKFHGSSHHQPVGDWCFKALRYDINKELLTCLRGDPKETLIATRFDPEMLRAYVMWCKLSTNWGRNEMGFLPQVA